MRPSPSVRKIAPTAGLSEARWRQIAQGFQPTRQGRVPVRGPADTIARMLTAEGELTAQEMATLAEFRPDVAALLVPPAAVAMSWEPEPLGIADVADLLRSTRVLIDQALRTLADIDPGRDRR